MKTIYCPQPKSYESKERGDTRVAFYIIVSSIMVQALYVVKIFAKAQDVSKSEPYMST